ncbi:DNA-binding domain-containing protein [Thalassotalea euphylliae]|uniref:DNA-binding domain-containing protein n=1 Tax=Thalassotalea euphylliae TaxID=1655234 RepID=UPI003628580E
MNHALTLASGQEVKLSGRHGTIKHIDNDVVFIKFGDKSYQHFAPHEIYQAANEGHFHMVEKPIDIRCIVEMTEKQKRECERRSAYCDAFLAFKDEHPTEGLSEDLINSVYEEIQETHARKPAVKTVYGWYKLWLSDGRDMALQVVHGNSRDERMPPEVKELMAQTLTLHYLKPSRPTINFAYRQFSLAFEAKGRSFSGFTMPSKSTFSRFIKRLPKYEVELKRYGKRHADRENRIAAKTFNVTMPLEVAECDAAEFNIGLLNGDGTYAGKVLILAIVDVATRACLGYTVQVSEKPAESAALVIHSLTHSMRVKQDPMRYPMAGIAVTYIFDNGPGFRAEMTRKFMNNIGSELTYCRSRRPEEKPHAERMFGTWRTKFFGKLPGYLGKRQKEIIQESTLRQAAKLTVTEFMELFETYVQDEYHHTPNKGINNYTPFQKWQKLARIDEVMTMSDLDDRLKIRGNAKSLTCTSSHGISHRGQRFQSTELKKAFANIVRNSGKSSSKVSVMIDDYDASAITVALPDGQLIEVPNVSGIDRDISFTQASSHMRKVTEKDYPESQTVQKARNKIKRKRANGTLVQSDSLVRDDELSQDTQTEMETDIEQSTTITDEERDTSTGFGLE